MNFLAHLFLSGDDEYVRLGNFMGDFIKGSQLKHLKKRIALGVLLHRYIDQYTDTHAIIREAKSKLVPTFGHYSSVIIDMYFDHFLALNWSNFSTQDLKSFTTHFYAQTEQNKKWIPQKCLEMLRHMKSSDWLYHYQYMEGLHKAFIGMKNRTTFPSNMDEAVDYLKKHSTLYEQYFNDFFPEIEKKCTDFRKQLLA